MDRAADGTEVYRSIVSVICKLIDWFDRISVMGGGVTKVKLFILCTLCILVSLKSDKINIYSMNNYIHSRQCFSDFV